MKKTTQRSTGRHWSVMTMLLFIMVNLPFAQAQNNNVIPDIKDAAISIEAVGANNVPGKVTFNFVDADIESVIAAFSPSLTR